jgi:hypothetical protein
MARSMAMPEVPNASEATAASLIPIVSTSLRIRFFSVLCACTSMRR